MNSRIIAPSIAAMLLATGACSAAPGASAPVAASATQSMAAGAVDFRSAKWLRDRTVVNDSGSEVAIVSDLILDRGSGRIEYLVAKTGTTLGMGGRAIVVPYESLRWEAAGKDRFILGMTADQLARLPEYTPEHWMAVNQASKDDKNLLQQRLAADAATPSDPYAGIVDASKKVRTEGEITAVERIRTTTFGEQVLITVRDSAGTTHRIALGPSWFVNGWPIAPVRGDRVAVDSFALPRDPDRLMVASKVQMGERTMLLRSPDGHPAWALKTVEVGGKTYTTPYSRYLLLSALPGMKVDCRGSECGKVQDIVLDRNSGEVGFISIDPNQNFLGIGDTRRLIPWSVASVTLDGTMRIDASKEMVLSTIETPSDLGTLNSGGTGGQVYRAFGVREPKFVRLAPVTAARSDGSDAWSARGPVVCCIESDSTITVEGTVLESTEMKFAGGVKSARALKIRVAGPLGGEETVILGPSAYMDNQKSMCAAGDTVKLEACRTTVAGQRYWIARSVTCNDTRVVLLDGNSAPVWAQQ